MDVFRVNKCFASENGRYEPFQLKKGRRRWVGLAHKQRGQYAQETKANQFFSLFTHEKQRALESSISFPMIF